MPFKFESLTVWQRSLTYVDKAYALAAQLPKSEEYNLSSQLKRAATSVALNIAEGSIGLSDAEQARFISIAIRSLVETVACLHLIRRRAFPIDEAAIQALYVEAEELVSMLHSLRRTLQPNQYRVKENTPIYNLDDEL